MLFTFSHRLHHSYVLIAQCYSPRSIALPRSCRQELSGGSMSTTFTCFRSSWMISFSCSWLLSQSTKISNSELRLFDFLDSMCTRLTWFSCKRAQSISLSESTSYKARRRLFSPVIKCFFSAMNEKVFFMSIISSHDITSDVNAVYIAYMNSKSNDRKSARSYNYEITHCESE